MKNKLKSLALAGGIFLAGALTGLEAKAAEDFVYGPITQNEIVEPDTVQEYLIEAQASGNGTVIGNTNNWIEEGQEVNLEAAPINIYNEFTHWSGVPFGMQNVNPLQYTNDQPRMNIIGNFSYITTPSGIPGEWLEQYNLPLDENLDSDSDSWKNLEEYFADTNPTNPLSYPQPLSYFFSNGGKYLEILETSSNRNYTFESCATLTNNPQIWVDMISKLGTGSNLIHDISTNSLDPTESFRYKVGLP